MQENNSSNPRYDAPSARGGIKCQSCGYDLTGVPIGQQCPECGNQVMPFGTNNQTSGKAIASMVLGIISIVTCMGYGIIGMPCAILAIIFAKKARLAIRAGTAPASSKGMASAGRVCGWIGVVLNSFMLIYLLIVIVILIIAAGAAAAGAAGNPTLLPF
tara:strand:- start:162460 stop:162936 length:477 start_codon:yes stop_codon:yes gene_type:complete